MSVGRRWLPSRLSSRRKKTEFYLAKRLQFWCSYSALPSRDSAATARASERGGKQDRVADKIRPMR